MGRSLPGRAGKRVATQDEAALGDRHTFRTCT
jgi:hypothetical protein